MLCCDEGRFNIESRTWLTTKSERARESGARLELNSCDLDACERHATIDVDWWRGDTHAHQQVDDTQSAIKLNLWTSSPLGGPNNTRSCALTASFCLSIGFLIPRTPSTYLPFAAILKSKSTLRLCQFMQTAVGLFGSKTVTKNKQRQLSLARDTSF